MIEVIESSRSSVKFSKLLGEEAPVVLLPSWLERDKNALKGTVTKLLVRTSMCPSLSTSTSRCTQVILLTVFYDFSNRTGAFGLTRRVFMMEIERPKIETAALSGWPLR